jgi:transcriptional regulator with XRE-family HTH domain
MNDEPTKYFFRQRQRNRLYDAVISAVEEAGIRRSDIANKLGINRSQVSRWLAGPANWEIDTISDILFSADSELDFKVIMLRDRAKTQRNRFHPAGEVRNPILSGGTTASKTLQTFHIPQRQQEVAATSTEPAPLVTLGEGAVTATASAS